ncbi:GH1 family beta-glucosidase [Lentzea jiangxiensis]|uniref:Beta-glucosidase n=1 Tax=Lentzea jiangxiensis TaxID=641025 RepID=A0A1H0IV20_9PSEU|nr:GH1 family beta-glucosidase [Lentzea jiangxiensis]SDO35328.1 beta-glucosidase [Lentzea jiangxiensis]
MENILFPQGFLWGAATAAFQVEGATAVDGRTDSIWDEFCRQPGRVVGGDCGEPAADHYRRFEQDVAMMADLGLQAYRFSIAWPRVRPDGGKVNPAGLDFYKRLIDSLLAHDIVPWPTLYHWDLPQTLEENGGWANRDTAYRFADYAAATVEALGDRVGTWTTLNEPWCSAFLGYAAGIHAPGRQEPKAAVAAVHHLLLGHGLAADTIRAAQPDAKVGITLNMYPIIPVDPDNPADLDVARRLDGLQQRIFLDPLLRGEYPADILEDLEPFGFGDHIKDGDLGVISGPMDMLGVNYYTEHYVSSTPNGDDGGRNPWVGVEHASFPVRNAPVTDMGWEVRPDGLTTVLMRVHQDYPRLPLYITENGAAFRDDFTGNGAIDDVDRTGFIASHLRAAHAAIEAGVDLRGYFCWSLLDNFEWAEGYAKRFGIVHVDYDTQIRTPKMSARWFSRVARDNALVATS